MCVSERFLETLRLLEHPSEGPLVCDAGPCGDAVSVSMCLEGVCRKFETIHQPSAAEQLASSLGGRTWRATMRSLCRSPAWRKPCVSRSRGGRPPDEAPQKQRCLRHGSAWRLVQQAEKRRCCLLPLPSVCSWAVAQSRHMLELEPKWLRSTTRWHARRFWCCCGGNDEDKVAVVVMMLMMMMPEARRQGVTLWCHARRLVYLVCLMYLVSII